jgi:hypothetical protein
MPRHSRSYWEFSPSQYQLIQEVQQAKRDMSGVTGNSAIRSDMYVMTNPVTGQSVSEKDLRYARDHLQEIYNSGMIREDRWAFLWYH